MTYEYPPFSTELKFDFSEPLAKNQVDLFSVFEKRTLKTKGRPMTPEAILGLDDFNAMSPYGRRCGFFTDDEVEQLVDGVWEGGFMYEFDDQAMQYFSFK